MEGITAQDHYAMAEYYMERSKLEVTGVDVSYQIAAQDKALAGFQQCLVTQERYRYWELLQWQQLAAESVFLGCEFYMAELLFNERRFEADVSVLNRVHTLHTCIRHYIDFCWTLLLYQLKLPQCYHAVLTLINPNGFKGRFDVRRLCEYDGGPVPMLIKDCQAAARRASVLRYKRPFALVKEQITDETSPELLDLAGKAVLDIVQAAEELKMYVQELPGISAPVMRSSYVQLPHVVSIGHSRPEAL